MTWATAKETNKWELLGSNTLTYNDNLFLLSNNPNAILVLPPGSKRSDFTNITGLGGTLRYKIGKQKILLNSQLSYNKYLNNADLDHVSTNNKALWQWRAGKYFSGDVGYNYRIYQGSFTNTGNFNKDLITEASYFAIGHFNFNSNWRLRGGINWSNAEHNNQARRFLDRQLSGFIAGVDYITKSQNSLGIEYSNLESLLPNLESNANSLVDNQSTQQTISAIFNWRLFNKTTIQGNLGYTQNNFRRFSARDFSGFTGNINLLWNITTKTELVLSLGKQLVTAADVTSNYLTSENISIQPSWKITPKIKLSGNFSWENLNYAGDPGLIDNATKRQDQLLSGQVGLTYTPIKNVNIDLAYRTMNRSSNLTGANFDSNIVMAMIEIKI